MTELVAIQKRHADEIANLLNNRNVSIWLERVPYPYTRSDADEFIELSGTAEYQKENVSYAIETQGIVIGGMGLHFKGSGNSEVGFWLGEDHWGKGFMQDALNKLIVKAKNEFALSKISAVVFDGNKSSEKLLKKCGFVFEKDLENYLVKNGEPKNCKLYSIEI